MPRITLRDIAVEAGVSKNAVSLALRNHPSISTQTRTRIQAISERLGYRPHALLSEAMAQLRAERRGQSVQSTIAVIHFMRDAVYEGIRAPELWKRGLAEAAARLGYGVDHIRFDPQEDNAERLRQTLHARGIRGLVLMEVHDFLMMQETCPFLYEEFASVLLGDVRAHWPAVPYVSVDAHLAARLCLAKAVEAGHRRIGFEVFANIDPNQRFLSGLQAHARTWGLAADIPPFRSEDPVTGDGVVDQPAFLNWYRTHKPECIIGTSIDYLRVLRESGVQVPGEVSYISWWANVLPEPLAGVDQRDADRAAAAVELLVARLQRGEQGVESCPRGLFIEPRWQEGPTLADIGRGDYYACRGEPFARVAAGPRRQECYDLRPHANQSFTLRGSAWFGLHPLLHTQPGRHRLAGVEVEVLDETQNQGRACILFRSTRRGRTPAAQLPMRLRLPLEGRVKAAYVLHAAAYLRRPVAFGAYVLRYEDGGTHRIPILPYIGRITRKVPDVDAPAGLAKQRLLEAATIADWWHLWEPLENESVRRVQVTSYGYFDDYPANLYLLEIVNPHPRRPLQAIEVETDPTQESTLGLLALTILR